MAPKLPRCPHATPGQACCAACRITHAAEAIVADASGQTDAFLRCPLEQQVLAALASLAPLPVTPLQVACLVDQASYRQIGTTLKALALLDAIEHPRKGYYRYRAGEL